jgi:hypothetical protein
MGGSDEAWTLDRVLGVMESETRTGVLEAVTADLSARIHFRNGYIVGVSKTDASSRWRLGDYLSESGAVTVEQIVSAQREATKKGLDVEEVLVKHGRISEDGLRRFADTLVLDELMPLFRLKDADFKFLEERPIPTRFATQLPVSFVLREAERQAARYDALRQRVGHPTAIYRKDAAVMGEVLGYEEPARGETALDLSANARAVYFFLDGERSLQSVSHAAALTLFDTYIAINELLDAWVVSVVSALSSGVDRGRSASHLARVVTVLTWFIVLAVLGLGGEFAWRNLDRLGASAASATMGLPPDDPRVAQAVLQMTHDGLQLYRLQRGTFPESLADLAEEGLMPRQRSTLLADLRYAQVDGGYTLESAPPALAPGNAAH